MRKGERKRCTAECTGTITRSWSTSGDSLGNIEVRYEVDGTWHTVRETVKARSETIYLLGVLPIGQMTRPKMGGTEVGTQVAVRYDPDDPAHAYVRDNVGTRTS